MVQLCHPPGEACLHRSRLYQLTVFHITGVHQFLIQYCQCALDSPSRRRQLLREKYFPATLIRPHTVFTFALLNFFHKLQSQNKTNLYDFYNTIIHLCNGAGLSPEIVSISNVSHSPVTNDNNQYRYNEISLVYRMWVNLHILKRGGAAHHPGGVESVPDGGMAVECPACPHPGRNVDADMLLNE